MLLPGWASHHSPNIWMLSFYSGARRKSKRWRGKYQCRKKIIFVGQAHRLPGALATAAVALQSVALTLAIASVNYTPDEDGKISTVRYEAANAMLLNEFLKEHRSGA